MINWIYYDRKNTNKISVKYSYRTHKMLYRLIMLLKLYMWYIDSFNCKNNKISVKYSCSAQETSYRLIMLLNYIYVYRFFFNCVSKFYTS